MAISKERRRSLLDEVIHLIDEVLKLVPEKGQMPRRVRDRCGYYTSGTIITRRSVRRRSEETGEIETQTITDHAMVNCYDLAGQRVDFKTPTKLLVQLASMAEDLEISIPEGCGFRTVETNGATLFHECMWRISMEGFRAKLVSERKYAAEEEKREEESRPKAFAKGDEKPRSARVNPKGSKIEANHHIRVLAIVEEWRKHHERPEAYFLAPLSASSMHDATHIPRRTIMRTVKEMFGITSGKDNGGWKQYELKCQKRDEFLGWLDRIINPSAGLVRLSPTQDAAGQRCNSCNEIAPRLQEYGEQELCPECYAVAVGKT